MTSTHLVDRGIIRLEQVMVTRPGDRLSCVGGAVFEDEH